MHNLNIHSVLIRDERLVGLGLALVHEHQRASERRSILSRPQPKWAEDSSRRRQWRNSNDKYLGSRQTIIGRPNSCQMLTNRSACWGAEAVVQLHRSVSISQQGSRS